MCWLQSSQVDGLDMPPFRFIPFAHCLSNSRWRWRRRGRWSICLRASCELSGELLHPRVKTNKSELATQPDSLDSERHGHISAPGQSKCDEKIHHRPVGPQFVPRGQLLDKNKLLRTSSLSVLPCHALLFSIFFCSQAIKVRRRKGSHTSSKADLTAALSSAFPLTDEADCWLCHRDREP